MATPLNLTGNTFYYIDPVSPLPMPTGPIVVNGGKNPLPLSSYAAVTELLAKLHEATGIEVRGQDFVWVADEMTGQPSL